MSKSKARYLTKSRHKLALECPTKLFYKGKPDQYEDGSVDDPFLIALARGGFQVGALAQCYYPGGVEVEVLEHAEALAQTEELLKREQVTIFEPAFRSGELFIRADILVKNGDQLRLIEVKSKSFDPEEESPFFDKRLYAKGKIKIKDDYAKYLYDVAFQTLVLKGAYPEFKVTSYLMLSDKSKTATVEGLNQFFLLGTDENGRTTTTVKPGLKKADLGQQVLCEINVDEAVAAILEDRDEGRPAADRVNGLPFAKEATYLADMYVKDQRIPGRPGKHCKTCEFRVNATSPVKSGFAECWTGEAKIKPQEVAEAFVFDVWKFRKSEGLIEDKKFFIKDLIEDDVAPSSGKDDAGLSSSQRQWLQVDFEQKGRTTPFVDGAGLKEVMAGFKYPLHFIDFETTMVAVPFSAGRRPYEQTAFQFSHHKLHQDGTIEHAGQFLSAARGKFPNYDFVRALKKSLGGDEGTIFRYSHHENSVLCQIHRQLAASTEADKSELMFWIEQVTKTGKGVTPSWEGSRSMVDLCDLVKKYYYHPATKGSNSIKYVLPAVLSDSKDLQEKFSKPIYGESGGIKSLNFKDWIWIKVEAGGVVDPYSLLPNVYRNLTAEQLNQVMCGNDELANGGSAMTAYSMMQFTEMKDEERQALNSALLKYCELDTFAMVLLYLYWDEFVSGERASIAA